MDTTTQRPDAEAATLPARFDEYVEYADGDATVVCDRTNASAWIRSTTTRPVRR